MENLRLNLKQSFWISPILINFHFNFREMEIIFCCKPILNNQNFTFLEKKISKKGGFFFRNTLGNVMYPPHHPSYALNDITAVLL